MGKHAVGLVAALVLLALPADARAGELTLSGTARWVVLASRPDLDAAIGVAHHHRWQFPNLRVVRAVNGWFAIVVGFSRSRRQVAPGFGSPAFTAAARASFIRVCQPGPSAL